MRHYYIITKLTIMKIGYRGEFHDRLTRQHPEVEVSEQRIAYQRRAIVTRGLLSKPRLEEIRAQVAENFKETNEDTEEGTTQTTDENRESRSSENTKTAENPEPKKNKNRILQGTKRI